MESELITVAVQTRERAEIIKARLADDGIDCMLSQTDTHFAPGFAGVRIMVELQDLQKAMEIIAALHFEFGDDEPLLEHKEDRIITIAVSSWQKAELMHEMLASSGIQSALINVNLLQADISGGVKLRVLEEDVPAAMKIIRGMQIPVEVAETGNKKTGMGEILVPVDFTDASLIACRIAASIAAVARADIRLFHAYFNPYVGTMPFDEASYTFHDSVAELFTDTEEGLKTSIELLDGQLRKMIRETGGKVRVSNTIVRGIASDAIIEYANNNRPGLIIMSRGLHEDRTGLFMGKVSGKVTEYARVPVMVVPNDYDLSGPSDLAHIAYATNFEDCDPVILQKLVSLTREFCRKLTCIHVSDAGEADIDKVRLEELRVEAKRITGMDLSCNILESDNILEGFNALIQNENIRLLAVTTHKRNFVTRLLYPSLTKRIMLHTRLPLLVFHA